jgi:MFS family permease
MAVEAEGAASAPKPKPADRAFDYAAHPPGQWRLVVLLTVVVMLSAVDRQALSLLVDPIRKDLGLNDGQMGILIGAAMAVTGLLVGPPAGFLADRFCRRCMVGASALLWSVLTAACGLSSSFGQLLAARAGVGLFEGVAAPATASMLRDALSPERRGRGFAVFAMAPMIGTGLAMLAGGAMIAAIGALKVRGLPLVGALHPWQMVFVLFGLIGLPAAALMIAIAEPRRTGHEASIGGASLSEAWTHLNAHGRIYWPLMAFATLHGMLSLSFAAWAPALLGRTWGLDPARIGLTFGILMLVLAPLGLVLVGTTIDRLARRGRPDPAGVGIVATLVIWTAATAMPIAPSPALFWTLLAVLLLASGAALPVASTILAEITPSRAMGKIVALQGLISGFLSATVAPSLPPALAAGLFHGAKRSLGDALSLAVFVYGALALLAVLMVRSALRRRP